VRFFCSLLLTLTLAGALGAADPFRDPKLPLEERVNNLVSLMTLDEKVAFLGQMRDCASAPMSPASAPAKPSVSSVR
jgi:hypothetical protein